MAYEGTLNDFKLDNAPVDCIQSVKFGQVDSQHLLAASWDGSVRLYDIKANQLQVQYSHEGPVLDATFQGNNNCWSGGVDTKVKRFDLQSQTETIVGQHEEPIRCVDYMPDMNLVATASWDRHLKLWDPRLAGSENACVDDITMTDKIYAMSVSGHKIIIGMPSENLCIYDLRTKAKFDRQSLSKKQIRCISSFPDQSGYVVGSIEGRVSVEYFEPMVESSFTFKCHRNKDKTTQTEYIYPVNAVSFHRKHGTLATGGSDGFVSIWDPKSKKRLTQFHMYPGPISSLCFSPDGNFLAIACSQLHVSEETQNIRDIPPDSIYIRRVHEREVKSKV